MLVKEFTHQLIESFRFSSKGEFDQAEIITVSAPKTQDFYGNVSFLDSLYLKAERRSVKDVAGLIKELDLSEAERAKAKEDEEKRVLELSDDEKALNVYTQLISGLEQNELKQLDICMCELLKSSAKVNGDKNFEAVFYENELCFEDRRLITGKYVLNFTSMAQKALKPQ